MSRAVVLLSGGLDSATVLALARQEGHACYALSFRYGQRHTVELEAAARVARALGAAEHRIADVDLRWIGGSALTADIAVPKDRAHDQLGEDIPVTYVPARNALFLTLALAWAEVLGARDLYAGMNALDYSGYPDCRPEFLRAFEELARLGTKAGVEGRGFSVHAPLMTWGKAEIIRRGVALGVDYGLTHSCYDPVFHARGFQEPGVPAPGLPEAGAGRGEVFACGRCDSCTLRAKGFVDAGVPDPTRYAPSR